MFREEWHKAYARMLAPGQNWVAFDALRIASVPCHFGGEGSRAFNHGDPINCEPTSNAV